MGMCSTGWPQCMLSSASRAILAGTSAKGVCPKCGAPWVRQVTDGTLGKTETPKKVADVADLDVYGTVIHELHEAAQHRRWYELQRLRAHAANMRSRIGQP
jgi:hypothetical protein